jgi:hypothetical protein
VVLADPLRYHSRMSAQIHEFTPADLAALARYRGEEEREPEPDFEPEPAHEASGDELIAAAVDDQTRILERVQSALVDAIKSNDMETGLRNIAVAVMDAARFLADKAAPAPQVQVKVSPTPIRVENVMPALPAMPPIPAPVVTVIQEGQKPGAVWEVKMSTPYGDQTMTIKRVS